MFATKKLVAAASAVAMLVAPTLASAAPDRVSASAAKNGRVTAPVAKKSKFAGIPIYVLLIGTAVLVTTVIVASDDDGSNSPG